MPMYFLSLYILSFVFHYIFPPLALFGLSGGLSHTSIFISMSFDGIPPSFLPSSTLFSPFPRCSRSPHPSLVFHHGCESRLSALPLFLCRLAFFALSLALIVLCTSVPLLRFAHAFIKGCHSRFSPACLPCLSSGLAACRARRRACYCCHFHHP